MMVSRHYSQEFLSYIEGNSDLFRLIWERDRISVYRITFN